MALKKGTDNIVKVYRGATEITKIYKGTELIYSASPSPQPTYSNKIYGHTRTASQTITLKVNGTSNSVTSDSSKYFELDCSGITITSLNQCAYNISQLGDITFDVDTGACTDFQYICASCGYATLIDLSRLDLTHATGMGFRGMFYNAQSAEIRLPSSGLRNAGSLLNLQFLFYNCKQLASIDASGLGNCDSVTNISGLFQGCTALTSIDLSGVFFDFVNTTANNVFASCSSLTSVKVAGCESSFINGIISLLSTAGFTFTQSGDYLVK